jgi:hypothetical protein
MASCPLVYSWTGSGWQLDSGTFGGAIAEGLARTDVDNLDHVRQHSNLVKLQVRNELPETDYLDYFSLLYIDHDTTSQIYPASDGTLHVMRRPVSPTRAVDASGRDVLDRLKTVDGVNWESRLDERDPSVMDNAAEAVELVFPRPADATHAKLIVHGGNSVWASHMLAALLDAHGHTINQWYDRINEDTAYAAAVRRDIAETGFLKVFVLTERGWVREGMVWEVGPEIAKTQVVPITLPRSSSHEVRVRLQAPPSFWLLDHVALDFSDAPSPAAKEVQPTKAIFNGATSVTGQLAAIDGVRQKIETGDVIDLEFDLPAVPHGSVRTFFGRSNGWYHVDRPGTGEPDVALLRAVAGNPVAMQRAALQRRNEAVARLHGR